MSLNQQIPKLTSYQIALEFEKIGGSIGDGHTWVSDRFKLNSYHYYPIYLRWFEDELRIVAVESNLKEVLGWKVIKIENHLLTDATQKVDSFIPKNENKYYQQYWEGEWLRNAEALYYLGITTSLNQANFTLQNDLGEEKTILLKINLEIKSHNFQWAYPQLDYMTRNQEAIWYQSFNDKKNFYIKINYYPSKTEMKKVSDKILEELQLNKYEKLIFDFRMNGGGDMTTGLVLIDKLAK